MVIFGARVLSIPKNIDNITKTNGKNFRGLCLIIYILFKHMLQQAWRIKT